MKTYKCEICKFDVHRASNATHLKGKKHWENEKQKWMITPEWLSWENFENKIQKSYTPIPLLEILLN